MFWFSAVQHRVGEESRRNHKKGLIEEVEDEEREFKLLGIRTQPVACLYKDSKYFPCFCFTDTHTHTHTHSTRMKRGVERVMDTLIVALADRLPVPHCYDANHHNTTVFKVSSNAQCVTHILLIYN